MAALILVILVLLALTRKSRANKKLLVKLQLVETLKKLDRADVPFTQRGHWDKVHEKGTWARVWSWFFGFH